MASNARLHTNGPQGMFSVKLQDQQHPLLLFSSRDKCGGVGGGASMAGVGACVKGVGKGAAYLHPEARVWGVSKGPQDHALTRYRQHAHVGCGMQHTRAGCGEQGMALSADVEVGD